MHLQAALDGGVLKETHGASAAAWAGVAKFKAKSGELLVVPGDNVSCVDMQASILRMHAVACVLQIACTVVQRWSQLPAQQLHSGPS